MFLMVTGLFCCMGMCRIGRMVTTCAKPRGGVRQPRCGIVVESVSWVAMGFGPWGGHKGVVSKGAFGPGDSGRSEGGEGEAHFSPNGGEEVCFDGGSGVAISCCAVHGSSYSALRTVICKATVCIRLIGAIRLQMVHAYLSGTRNFMPTPSVFRGWCRCCLICAC